MTTTRPKILLSEGSSLSSREAITALGLAGHRVELVSCDPLCLGRFSRFVSRVHRAPASGADPDGYLTAVIDVARSSGIDVLLPVHEQAYLLAAARQRLRAGPGFVPIRTAWNIEGDQERRPSGEAPNSVRDRPCARASGGR